MRFLCICSVFLISLIISCKKTVVNPTTTIYKDTTIVIQHDTTITNNIDTTILQGDKQIRFSIPGVYSMDSSYKITDPIEAIPKFNIDNYPGVDSIFYQVYILAGNSLQVELYDMTDSIALPGTLITATSTGQAVMYQSGNIISALPHKEINLGLRMKASSSTYTSVLFGYLFLYRK